MTGSTRSSDGLDVRRRKVLFRAWHRGMRETDLILGRFADAAIADLSDAEIGDFEQLLEATDRDVLAWLLGEYGVPPEFDTPLFGKLCAFHRQNGTR
jgi:antitoxin CptB